MTLQPPSFSTCILIPTYNNAFVLDQCLEYLEKLNPQPTYYIIAENNSTDTTISVLNDFLYRHKNAKLIRLWFRPDARNIMGSPYAIIGIIRQLLLKKARQLGVDYAIFVDDDIFLADKDFISKIIAHKKDLVGGAYFRSYPQGDLLSYLAYNTKKNKKKFPYVLRNYQRYELQEVAAISGGCMCISKKLLMDSRVNFVDDDLKVPDYYSTGHAGEDFAYCITAQKNGYRAYVDDSFRICHYQDHEARAWKVDKEGNYIEFKYK